MKKYIYFCAGLIVISTMLFNTYIIQASASQFWQGLFETRTEIGYSSEPDEGSSLFTKIGSILSISTVFLGVVFLGLMIYAGFIWMMARGNEQEVARAKNIIIYAVIGLVVVLAAYAITQIMSDIWNVS